MKTMNPKKKAYTCIIADDNELDRMNGLDLRKQLQKIPACIFVTSHFYSIYVAA
jgi:hypothetical protein